MTQPYYTYRAPYPAIAEALANAGAQTNPARAKEMWLEKCSNTDEAARKAVAASPDLFATLIGLQKDRDQKFLQDQADTSAENYREIFAPSVERGEITQEQFDAGLRRIYEDAGLSPPEDGQN